MIIKSEYILLFVLMVFLFYHLINNCGCYNGVNNRVVGFSVGGQSNTCNIKNLDCLKTKQCKDMDLSNCDLSDRDLSKSDLRDANLSGTNLSDANLSNADLYSTNLSKSNLSGADLSGANLKYSTAVNPVHAPSLLYSCSQKL